MPPEDPEDISPQDVPSIEVEELEEMLVLHFEIGAISEFVEGINQGTLTPKLFMQVIDMIRNRTGKVVVHISHESSRANFVSYYSDGLMKPLEEFIGELTNWISLQANNKILINVVEENPTYLFDAMRRILVKLENGLIIVNNQSNDFIFASMNSKGNGGK